MTQRVALVDDHQVVTTGLQQVLAGSEFEYVGASSKLVSAAKLIEQFRPDVVVLDVFVGDDDSWQLCRRLADRGVVVVMYSGHGNAQLLDRAMASGASGYMLKSMPLERVVEVLRAVRDRGEWWDRQLLTEWTRLKRSGGDAKELFTDRELDIIKLIAQGLDNFEIAERLHISSHTVKFHIAKALRRTGEANRAGLVRRASELNLIQGE